MTKTKTKQPDLREACAAQHFGPWMAHAPWMMHAVAAVRDGTFKPRSETVAERDADGNLQKLYDKSNGLAVIYVQDQIVKGDSSFGGTSSLRVRRALRLATNDPEVSAIVLHIDSPGGTVSGTQQLADDIAEAREKMGGRVYAHIDDLGASAAYWLASQTSRITANRTAQIGSIGTYLVLDDTSGRYEKEGVKVHLIATGEHKGAGVDGVPISDAHLAKFREEVEALNEHFLAAVAAGRGRPIETVREWATGEVWIADEAARLGLIDEVSSFEAVIDRAATEIHDMNHDQFKAFASENPEAIAPFVAKGKDQGHAEGVASAIAMLEAFPGKADFALSQLKAGNSIDQAKAERQRIDAERKADADAIASLAAENAKLKALAGTQAPIENAGKVEDKPAKPAADASPQQKADWEWDNDPAAQKDFKDKAALVRYHERVAQGRVKAK